MSAHGMIFFLMAPCYNKARMITGFSKGVLSSLLSHQQTYILLVVVIILIWMDTQPWYFHFSNLKHFLKLNGFGEVFWQLNYVICYLYWSYMWEGVVYLIPVLFTQTFPTVTDLPHLVLRLVVPACLISRSSKLWEIKLWSWSTRFGCSKYH